MRSISFSAHRAAMRAAFLLPGLFLLLGAQTRQVVTVPPPVKAAGQRNGTISAKLSVQLSSGYHVNSNTPVDDYMIPLRLTWNASPLEVAEVVYPKPQMEKYPFSEKPLSVFTGDFEILTRFKVPASAPPGPRVIPGKLRYQACSQNLCLPPRTLDIGLPVEIR